MSQTGAADKGFTLLELLIVMSVLSATTAVVISLSAARKTDLALQKISFGILKDLRHAAAEARRLGRDQRVLIKADGEETLIEFPRKSVPITKEFSLAWKVAAEAGSSERSAVIVFFAAGGSSGGSVVVSSRASRTTIDVDWLTSRIHLREDRG
jgi:general secretion pathway protein H